MKSRQKIKMILLDENDNAIKSVTVTRNQIDAARNDRRIDGLGRIYNQLISNT